MSVLTPAGYTVWVGPGPAALREVRCACSSCGGRRRSLAPWLAWQEGDGVRQVLGESAATPVSRLVELPGRGTTRVWECAGPRGADTLMLIHGVTFTAELNWAKVFAPLARHFHVVAADLRGHGDGIRTRSRFPLAGCADA